MCSAGRAALPFLLLLVLPPASLAGPREFAPWLASGFPGSDQRWLEPDEIYPRGAPTLPYQLDATVVFARQTPWTEARAIRQIRRTADIFEPCGIRLGRVRLARLPLERDQRRIDIAQADPVTGVPAVVANLSARLAPTTPYPAAFLIADVAGTESLAVSYRAGDQGGPGAPYLNTAWIGYRAHWLPRRDRAYSVLAHELAHLLCRCGHTAGPAAHLLHSARNFLAAKVLPEHCQMLVSSLMVTATN